MKIRLFPLVAVGVACSLVIVSCSSDEQVRNATFKTTTTAPLKLAPITAPKISISPTTTIADPQSDIDGSRIQDVDLSGAFTPIDVFDCLERLYRWMRDANKGSEPEFSHAAYLTGLYYEFQVRNGGTVECEDPASFWQELQDWVSKLVHKPLPSLKLTVKQFAPWYDQPYVNWRDEVKVEFPSPEPGTIWAIDIDPETGRGTPWILDHLYRRAQRCGTSDVQQGRLTGVSFHVENRIRDINYDPNSRSNCVQVSAKAFGVTVDGRDSDHEVALEDRTVSFRRWNSEDDKFVVVGFGDSYGSGEGNPGSAISYSIRSESSFIDSSRYSDPESMFWPEGELNEFKVNTQFHDDCHRSSESGIAKAVKKLADEYTGDIMMGHFACSGAKLNDIAFTGYQPDFFGFERFQETQLSQALSWLSDRASSPNEVDAVVISGGGNDANFSDVIKDCFITPFACNDDSDEATYLARTGTVVPLRMERLTRVLLQVFPNAKIFFTAYTDGISVLTDYDEDGDTACSEADDPWFTSVEYDSDEFWDIRADDARWVRGFLNTLNQREKDKVAAMASQGTRIELGDYYEIAARDTYGVRASRERMYENNKRVFFIDEQFSSFKNNGFCTRSRRNITFNDQAIIQQGNDQLELWSSGGWHPNDYGYQLYGNAISSFLAEQFPQTTFNLRSRR